MSIEFEPEDWSQPTQEEPDLETLAWGEALEKLEHNPSFMVVKSMMKSVADSLLAELHTVPIDSPNFALAVAERRGVFFGVNRIRDFLEDILTNHQSEQKQKEHENGLN